MERARERAQPTPASERPLTARPAPAAAVLALQRSAGNQAVAFELATSGSATEVPRRGQMEAAFGTSFAGVKAHVGGAPAQAGLGALGARAAASGERVAFADSDPAADLIAHELAHVVQQRRGAPGVALDRGSDSAAERAARRAGEAVAAGRAAPDVGTAAPGDIQLAQVTTTGGVWETKGYGKFQSGSQVGGHIELYFTPKEPVVAEAIGLVQSVKTDLTVAGTTSVAPPINPTNGALEVPDGHNRGVSIDQRPGATSLVPPTSPLYAADAQEATVNAPLGKEVLGKGKHAARTIEDGKPVEVTGWISDTPKRQITQPGQMFRQNFEVTAVALDGPLKGMYLGSILWGWTNDEKGEPRVVPPEIEVLREGRPSAQFMAAAKQWNDTVFDGRYPTVDLPLDQDVDPATLTTAQLTVKVAEAAAGAQADFKARALQRELAKRKLRVIVRVIKTDDEKSDQVYLTLQNKRVHKTEMAQGEVYAFGVALGDYSPTMPPAGPVLIEVFDHDALSRDDRALSLSWSPPERVCVTGSAKDGANYELTVAYDR